MIIAKTIAAMELAHELLAEHGLAERGWVADTDRAKRRLGVCRYSRRQISISREHIEKDSDVAVRDTILHEIAHALAWTRYGCRGHGPEWKAVCREIGAEPTRLADASKVAPRTYRWNAICPCGWDFHRHRLTAKARRSLCGRCRTPLQWRESK